MGEPRLDALEKKMHDLEKDTVKSMGDLAREIHGLTVELRHDREDRNKANARVQKVEEDLVDVKINQAGLKDFRAVMGKGLYIIFGGVISILVGGVIAAVKIAGLIQSYGVG